MASTAYANPTLKLEYGVPQTFALKYLTGKPVESRYPGGRVMFTTSRGSLFLNDEDASDLERGVREIAPAAGEEISVTLVKMPHGGGHAIRVAPVSDAAEDAGVSALERQLAESLAARDAKKTAAAAVQRTDTAAATATVDYTQQSHDRQIARPDHNPTITPAHARFLAAYMVAVDVLAETKVYAQRKGMALEPRCEDVRTLAATIIIDAAKGGR